MARSILKLVTNLLLIILLSTPAYAGIGSITEFRGAGQVKRAVRVIPAARGTSIEKNDTVSTTSQGRFKITFVDATTVNVTENSRLVIDDFVFDGGNQRGGRLGLRVALGTVRYASGGVAHGNPRGVNIRTPTATIGVRGTDFVMSVDEAGRSMVVLLPNCFDDKDPTKNIDKCETGEIEVTTAAGVVLMNQPFQATVVENTFTPPSPPAIINISMSQLDNSMQVSAPPTTSGVSIVAQARSDLKAITNPAQASADGNAEPETGGQSLEQAAAVATLPDPETVRQASESVTILVNSEVPSSQERVTIYTNVSPTYDQQRQAGWAFSILSPDKRNAAGVFLPLDTEAQVTVTQDGSGANYNFSNHTWPESGTGRPNGNITIIQRSGQ